MNNVIEKYSVKEWLSAETGQTFTDQINLESASVKTLTNIEMVKPLQIDIEATHIDDGMLVILNTEAFVELECATCLTHFESSVRGSLEEYLQQPLDVDQGKIDRDSNINLSQQIIDTFVPSLPTLPKCREDCKGLCAVCGVNLNDKHGHYKDKPDHAPEKSALGNTIRIRNNESGIKNKKDNHDS